MLLDDFKSFEIDISPAELSRFSAESMDKYYISLRQSEKDAFKRPKEEKPSAWAEKNRHITVSSIPGPWRNITTPYLTEIMDSAFFPSVETIIICAAPQTGKSESVNNCIGYTIDKRPGSVLYVYPDELTAKENSKDRILPMVESSPRLRKYLTGFDDDTSYRGIRLKHLQIYMGWARSAARLANKPLPYVVFDEIDKYPETAGKKEASPISLGEKRTRIFGGFKKIFKLSTPTIEAGPIWQALTTEANVVFDFWVQCPVCGEFQLLEFNEKQFRFPKNVRDPEVILSKDLAWIECLFCHTKWDNEKRNVAVMAGKWLSRESAMEPAEYLAEFRPKKIGFHIPAWISRFVPISEVCAKFLKGTKDKTELKDFMNNYCAKPWIEYSQKRKVDKILALRDDRPRGVVPGGNIVAGMTAGVDTQDNGFWYEIRAWGYGIEQQSWSIREGFLLTFDDLKKVLWQDEYFDPDGKKYIINFVVQDAMGHKTAEVYNFAIGNRGRMLPSAGRQRQATPFSYGDLEYFPGTKKRIPGGLKIINVNTEYFKNYLDNKLDIEPGDPGAWLYNSELDEDMAAHMVAEYWDEESAKWDCPSGRANHLWDCSVLNLVAADVLGIKHWPRPGSQPATAKPKPKPKKQKSSRW